MNFPTNTTRTDWERRFNLMRELGIKGRLRFSEGARLSAESLLQIKEAPNGRYNLISINELAATSAMMSDFINDDTKVI